MYDVSMLYRAKRAKLADLMRTELDFYCISFQFVIYFNFEVFSNPVILFLIQITKEDS